MLFRYPISSFFLSEAGDRPHILAPKIVGPLYMSSLALFNKTFRLKGFAIRNIPPCMLLDLSSSFLIKDDKKIIGIFCVRGSLFKIRATSLPSMSGIRISRMIKSGWSFLAILTASCPPEARSMWNSLPLKTFFSILRLTESSSAISIFLYFIRIQLEEWASYLHV